MMLQEARGKLAGGGRGKFFGLNQNFGFDHGFGWGSGIAVGNLVDEFGCN